MRHIFHIEGKELKNRIKSPYVFVVGFNRGGIIETTVDHSDIRGLGTACHGFVVELPLSEVGSYVDCHIP